MRFLRFCNSTLLAIAKFFRCRFVTGGAADIVRRLLIVIMEVLQGCASVRTGTGGVGAKTKVSIRVPTLPDALDFRRKCSKIFQFPFAWPGGELSPY